MAGSRTTEGTRGRKARRHVAVVMILAALVSAMLVGVYNFLEGRNLINGAVNGQLVDVATNRAVRIGAGLASLQDRTAALASEPSVRGALSDLGQAFAETDATLNDQQEADLQALYREGIDILTPPGVTPPATSTLLPATETGRYLQYWYVTQAPPDARPDISDPGDGSTYTEVHARYHDGLVDLTASLGLAEALLIDLDGDVVFTIAKRADFATNLLTGPYRDSALADAIDRLASAAVGDVVLVDFEPYLPASGQPVLWSVTAVQNEGEVVGALAIPVPNDILVAITTAAGDWEALGLGQTGEVYIVGPDGLLRTESRRWLEDPTGYLETMADAGYPEETIDAVRDFGTTVLLQPVVTAPVEAALRGDRYEGTGPNYLGERTRSVSGPFVSSQLGWVIVTEVQTSEISAPLRSYVWRLLLVAALAVPIVIGIAIVIARRMLRPIEPIVAGADRVATGDIDVTLEMRGHDEFSDLAGQFDAFVAELRRQRSEIERTDAETTELLGSVIPNRLVDEFKAGNRTISEALRNASIVTAIVAPQPDAGVTEDDIADFGVGMATGFDELADRLGAERLDASASALVYAVGLGSESLEVEATLRFAVELRRWADRAIAEGDLPIAVGIGVAGGDVIAHVVGTQRLAFEVLGTPRRLSEALARRAAPDGVLIDAVIAGRADGRWTIDRVDGLETIDGIPVDGWRIVLDAALAGDAD